MIQFVAETGSTNADLVAALGAGEAIPEGHWRVADRQTGGRGRQGKAWFDGFGNFMGSTVVRVSPSDPAPATLTLVAAMALFESVSRILADPAALRIKWPNDVLLNGAKLSGILLERSGNAIVIGIGVNLASAPELPDRRTVALSAFGPAPDRDMFARSLAENMTCELERWRSYGVEPLASRWMSVAHPEGTPLMVQAPGEGLLEGSFAGLTPDGALRLTLGDGATRIIHAGDVMLAAERG